MGGAALNAEQAQAALDMAEIQIASEVGIVEKDGLGLALREDLSVRFYIRKGEIYPTEQAIEVPTGPLVLLTTVTIDGVDRTGDIVIRDYWSIRWDDGVTSTFTPGSKIEMVADVGWVADPDDGTPLPAAVKSAVLAQAAGIYSNLSFYTTGQVKLSERIGDWAASYQPVQGGAEVIAPLVRPLLRSVRRTPYLGA
jgi:hypothetical protein